MVTESGPAVVVTPVFWQLVYPGGVTLTEPPYHASIKESPVGAVQLNVVDARGSVLTAVPMYDEDGTFYLPIFYRVHSMSIATGVGGPPPTRRLDATVFGRGRTGDGRRIDCLLRMHAAGRVIERVDGWFVSEGQIVSQLNR